MSRLFPDDPPPSAFVLDVAALVGENRIHHLLLGGLNLLAVGGNVVGLVFLWSGELARHAPAWVLPLQVVGLALYSIPGLLLLRSAMAAKEAHEAVDPREAIVRSLRAQRGLWRMTTGFVALWMLLMALFIVFA